jgi:hypothetical protein
MKVSELIKFLETQNQDASVVYRAFGFDNEDTFPFGEDDIGTRECIDDGEKFVCFDVVRYISYVVNERKERFRKKLREIYESI